MNGRKIKTFVDVGRERCISRGGSRTVEIFKLEECGKKDSVGKCGTYKRSRNSERRTAPEARAA